MFKSVGTFVVLSFAILSASAQDNYPKLGALWLEKQISNPEGNVQTGRTLTPLSNSLYKYESGKYKSSLSRITVSIPLIGDEHTVSIRESVVSSRPNGIPITSHILFVPGFVGAAPNTDDGVSAVVVTLLRDDRSKDTQSILSRFEPPNEGVRALYAQQGVEYTRQKTNMGDAVQRIFRNRLADEPFPYKSISKGGTEMHSIGVTRYVVAPNDSLIEFSQVVPCKTAAESTCRQKALSLMDKFMIGVSEFLLIADTLKSMDSTTKQ